MVLFSLFFFRIWIDQEKRFSKEIIRIEQSAHCWKRTSNLIEKCYMTISHRNKRTVSLSRELFQFWPAFHMTIIIILNTFIDRRKEKRRNSLSAEFRSNKDRLVLFSRYIYWIAFSIWSLKLCAQNLATASNVKCWCEFPITSQPNVECVALLMWLNLLTDSLRILSFHTCHTVGIALDKDV